MLWPWSRSGAVAWDLPYALGAALKSQKKKKKKCELNTSLSKSERVAYSLSPKREVLFCKKASVKEVERRAGDQDRKIRNEAGSSISLCGSGSLTGWPGPPKHAPTPVHPTLWAKVVPMVTVVSLTHRFLLQ